MYCCSMTIDLVALASRPRDNINVVNGRQDRNDADEARRGEGFPSHQWRKLVRRRGDEVSLGCGDGDEPGNASSRPLESHIPSQNLIEEDSERLRLHGDSHVAVAGHEAVGTWRAVAVRRDAVVGEVAALDQGQVAVDDRDLFVGRSEILSGVAGAGWGRRGIGAKLLELVENALLAGAAIQIEHQAERNTSLHRTQEEVLDVIGSEIVDTDEDGLARGVNKHAREIES